MKKYVFLILLLPNLALGAISFDSTSQVSVTSSSGQIWNHTIGAGDDPFLLVYCFVRPSAVPTSVTFNGDPLEFLTARTQYLNTDTWYLYYLANPDVGTHNVSLNLSGSNFNGCVSASYFGVSPYNPTSYSSDPGDGSSNDFTIVATTTEANSWTFAGWASHDGTCTEGTGSVIRNTTPFSIADSGADIASPGNHSMNLTSCGNRIGARIWLSLQPATSSPPEDPGYEASTSPAFVAMNELWDELFGLHFGAFVTDIKEYGVNLVGLSILFFTEWWALILAICASTAVFWIAKQGLKRGPLRNRHVRIH